MEERNRPGEVSGRPAVEEWQVYHARHIPELEALNRRLKRPADVAVMRSSQLDASRLDIELTGILQEQLSKAFSILQPIFRLSIWKGKPSPGLALMNLRYRSESNGYLCNDSANSKSGGSTGVEGPTLGTTQRVLWGLWFVFGRYFWARLESVAAAYHWADQPEGSRLKIAWKWLQRLETAYKVASFANLIAFLRFGRYRNIIERMIGSRLVYQRANQPRALSFEYLNRQLVWHELSELILFILPLINLEKIKNAIWRVLPQNKALRAVQGIQISGVQEEQQCHICHRKDIVLPCLAQPCHHMFCYYCLTSRTEHEVGFKCPRCNSLISSVKRWTNPVPAK